MTEHRVSTHLGVDAATYDAQIRRFVPGYETMLDTVVSIVGDAVAGNPAPSVLDLGAGTGALSAAIATALPHAHLELLDIDPSMLEVARQRLAARSARATLRCASFVDELPSCDAIVASLSLHHVADPAAKGALYRRIRAALRPGGVFLSADATVHASGQERARAFREWEDGMRSRGIPAAEARALFAQWAGEDFYLPLAVELRLLADAGFARPECFWKQGASTVFGAYA